MSNYLNKTLPNFAPVGYDEWKKQQDAKKASVTVNGSVFKDATSQAIMDAAMKSATERMQQSVSKNDFTSYNNIIPQEMIDGFNEYNKKTETSKKPSASGNVNTQSKPSAPQTEKPAQTVSSATTVTKPQVSAPEYLSAPEFQVSEAYKAAMDYTNSLLQQMNSGRTAYTDKINSLMAEYENRDKFSYDMATDPMFQQMLASSMNSGRMAMEDTIGQAAALTGGYGNTYGTRAGNAAYNQYISEAYGNLPEYYELALQAYNAEGDQMMRELAMLQDADNREYGRLVDAYNANLGAANDLYNQEYSQYVDKLNQTNYENERAYKAYIDQLNQANYESERAYNAAQDEKAWAFKEAEAQRDQANIDKEYEYRKEQDKLDRDEREDEIEYQRELDLIAALGGESEEYDNLTKSEIEHIVDVFVANGGASGNGFEAANQELSVMGKNNFDDKTGESLVAILEGTRSHVEDYIDAINGMNISQERKAALIQEVISDFKNRNYK